MNQPGSDMLHVNPHHSIKIPHTPTRFKPQTFGKQHNIDSIDTTPRPAPRKSLIKKYNESLDSVYYDTPRPLLYSNRRQATTTTRSSQSSSSTPVIPSRQIDLKRLTLQKDDIYMVFKSLKCNSHELDIQDREWLKIRIEGAFLGSSLIGWLKRYVGGFVSAKEIYRYADRMLQLGLIESPVFNDRFSTNCHYTLSRKQFD